MQVVMFHKVLQREQLLEELLALSLVQQKVCLILLLLHLDRSLQI